MRQKFLITGRKGQTGYELARVMTLLGDVIDVDIDISKPELITSTMREHKPDIVLNCAAYTAVDTAEEKADHARIVNAEAPGIFAEELKKYGGLMVHFSTDYAYDGTKKAPYHENDPVSPLSEYAKTKIAGDDAIIATGVKHLIFRTSWIYGARGRNFLQTMLQLLQNNHELHIVNDQLGAPTWARSIAEGVGMILAQKDAYDPANSGLYNMTSDGKVTWYEFAVHISKYYEKRYGKRVTIFPQSSGKYPMKAKRPKYAILDNSKLKNTFRISMPHWLTSFRQVMEGMGFEEPDSYKNLKVK